jgi:hypothetical protein
MSTTSCPAPFSRTASARVQRRWRASPALGRPHVRLLASCGQPPRATGCVLRASPTSRLTCGPPAIFASLPAPAPSPRRAARRPRYRATAGAPPPRSASTGARAAACRRAAPQAPAFALPPIGSSRAPRAASRCAPAGASSRRSSAVSARPAHRSLADGVPQHSKRAIHAERPPGGARTPRMRPSTPSRTRPVERGRPFEVAAARRERTRDTGTCASGLGLCHRTRRRP